MYIYIYINHNPLCDDRLGGWTPEKNKQKQGPEPGGPITTSAGNKMNEQPHLTLETLENIDLSIHMPLFKHIFAGARPLD